MLLPLLFVFVVAAPAPAPVADPAAVVAGFVRSYNQRDFEDFAAALGEDARWYSVDGGTVSVDGEGREAITAWTRDYLTKSCASCRSELLATARAGRFVTTVERARWARADGACVSQTSAALYEVADGRIVAVWYYPPSPQEPLPAAACHSDAPRGQGAAEIARAYFAALGAGRYREAWRLLDEDSRPAGADEADFAAAFAKYAEYRAEVGAPGDIEGAAGSLRIQVPVRVWGRMKNGEAFDSSGTVVLLRCNDVPGCTGTERQWRIAAENIGLRP